MTHSVSPPTDPSMGPAPTERRWKVACINWGHPDAPHAMTYRLTDGEIEAERYWPTWTEAIAYVQKACTRPLWTDLLGIDPDYCVGEACS